MPVITKGDACIPPVSHNVPTIAVHSKHRTYRHTALPRSLSDSDSAIVGSHGRVPNQEEDVPCVPARSYRAHPRMKVGLNSSAGTGDQMGDGQH